MYWITIVYFIVTIYKPNNKINKLLLSNTSSAFKPYIPPGLLRYYVPYRPSLLDPLIFACYSPQLGILSASEDSV